jgi:hypothetical protein
MLCKKVQKYTVATFKNASKETTATKLVPSANRLRLEFRNIWLLPEGLTPPT